MKKSYMKKNNNAGKKKKTSLETLMQKGFIYIYMYLCSNQYAICQK